MQIDDIAYEAGERQESGPVLVVTAAKAIQQYVLRSDKLQEMVGASELIDQLCTVSESDGGHRNLLEHALSHLRLGESECRLLSGVAGGARILFFKESSARRFVELWPLLVSQYAPGLELAQAIVLWKEKLGSQLQEAEARLAVNRNTLFPSLPQAGPLVERNPRSGLPGVSRLRASGSGERSEVFDAEAERKRSAAASVRNSLLKRVIPPEFHRQLDRFPTDITRIVQAENRSIAIVHADANGLGAIVRALSEKLNALPANEAIEVYHRFSTGMARAAAEAIRKSIKPVLLRTDAEAKEGMDKVIYPFRPVVCAGDDVTLILRAEDALDFTESYIREFERLANECLETLGVGKRVSACAGIAFVKVAYPFAQAYELCESLCAHAKKETGRSCSAIAFHRLTSSGRRDYEDELTDSLQAGAADGAGQSLLLTMNPYTVGKDAPDSVNPRIEDLIQLIRALNKFPSNSIRDMASQLECGDAAAKRAYDRLCAVRWARDRKAGNAHVAALEDALRRITHPTGGGESGSTANDSCDPCVLWTSARRTPLHDALELRALDCRLPGDSTDQKP